MIKSMIDGRKAVNVLDHLPRGPAPLVIHPFMRFPVSFSSFPLFLFLHFSSSFLFTEFSFISLPNPLSISTKAGVSNFTPSVAHRAILSFHYITENWVFLRTALTLRLSFEIDLAQPRETISLQYCSHSLKNLIRYSTSNSFLALCGTQGFRNNTERQPSPSTATGIFPLKRTAVHTAIFL